MSAKAKSKIKNNESNLADASAITSAPETTPTNAEHTPAVAEPPAANVAAAEAPSRPPLALRARIATSKAVSTLFARVRTAQSKVMEKSLAWITAADANISRSLLASEQYLLTRLRVTVA